MRRFELAEGASNKFWQVEVSGSDMAVTFGRIGTAGQSKTQTFADNAGAQAEADKLIREKTKKGYSEVGGEAASAAPASASKIPGSVAASAPASPPKPAQAEIEKPAKTGRSEKAESSALSLALDACPDGEIHWTSTLQRRIPVSRGVYVPPWTAPAVEPLPTLSHTLDGVERIARALGQATDKAAAGPEALRQNPAFSPERWKNYFLGMLTSDWRLFYEYESALSKQIKWAIDLCLAVHGPRLCGEHWLIALKEGQKRLRAPHYIDYLFEGMKSLRHALAALPEIDYDAVRAQGKSLLGESVTLNRILMFLLPELSLEKAYFAGQAFGASERRWFAGQNLAVDFARLPEGGYFDEPVYVADLLHRHGVALLDVFEKIAADEQSSPSVLKTLATFLPIIHHPRAVDLAIRHADRLPLAEVLRGQLQQWPQWVAARILDSAPAADPPAHFILLDALDQNPAWRDALTAAFADQPTTAARFAALQARHAPRREAALADLPEALCAPPWRQKRPVALPVLDVAVRSEAPVIAPIAAEPPGLPNEIPRTQLFRVMASANQLRDKKRMADWDDERKFLWLMGIQEGRVDALACGEGALTEAEIEERYFWFSTAPLMFQLSLPLQKLLWHIAPVSLWQLLKADAEFLTGILKSLGQDALDPFLRYAQARPETALAAALPVDWDALAPLAAHAFGHVKKARPAAQRWLRAHPHTAARALLPLAFSSAEAAPAARQVLRWLAENGERALLDTVAQSYGVALAEAWTTMIETPGWRFLPPKMPKLPAWLHFNQLPAPQLPDGACLPAAVLPDLTMMLAISPPDDPYAGLVEVQALCTPASLSAFAGAIFEKWRDNGAPKKDDWVLNNLFAVGDKDIVRLLTTQIRAWPNQSAMARAVQGIEVLAAVGGRGGETGEVALLYLNALATKAQQRKLKDAAAAALQRIADERGLTAEELADRLVPDLGLDERGSLRLDYGPRQYFVKFDETLAPYVADADGKRQKSIPRPNKDDDPAKAEAATALYRGLKKDVDAVAKQQITRLENAMRRQRRWAAEEFEQRFVRHPLVRHLSQRLVWGVFDADDRLLASFRLAEDLSLLDANDDTFTLSSESRLGIAHRLELGEVANGQWGNLFADYQILQPFAQLGRPTYAPTAAEIQARAITRFARRKVAVTSLLGLKHRGWEEDMDERITGFYRHFPQIGILSLRIEPGFYVNDYQDKTPQTLPSLSLHDRRVDRDALPLETLNAVQLSEAIRDADMMLALD